ncbi:MAG: InlB B-repeat-containing protein [Bacilli bacterium]|nr:InlB B-repeat-containing protein [Bacilli bacterium]
MKKKIIIIASIILAIIIGLLLYFLVFKNKDNKPKPTNNTAETITIKFDEDGGEEVDDIKIKKGTSTTLPTTTKEGYTLEGWYLDDEKIDEEYKFKKDTTLKAKWEEVKEDEKVMKITFDSKGGSKVNAVEIKCNDNTATINSLPKPTKEGFTFRAWEDKSGKVILLGAKLTCEDVTLYAGYDKKEETKNLTVTFDSNGGSKVNDMTFKCGTDGSATLNNLPKPKKDSYEFRAWEDKNGKSILDGAKIVCDGDKPTLKLTAGWEYDGPTANPEQKPEDSKTLKCPSGYTLNADTKKCTMEGTVSEKCPDGTKVDGSLCIKTSDSNAGNRVCKEDTIAYDGKGHTWTGRGDYYFYGNSYGKCAYYEWKGENYNTKSKCEAAYDIYHKTVWVSELNGCYAETKMNNYETVCASDYQFYSSSDLSSKFGIHDNGKCLKKVAKEKYCAEGYTLTSGKCIKTIDATLE